MKNCKMEQDEVEKMLKKIVDDPQIIPGVHNYCDRWCERCTLTNHCSVYKMEIAMENEDSETDVTDKKYWEHIGVMFNVAAKLLDEKMKELDIKPEDLPDESDPEYDPHDHPTVKLANDYTHAVSNWLKEYRGVVEQKHELYTNIDEKKAYEIADAYEIVQYYFIMISTKTFRCHIPTDDDFMDDALGSAKIATIIIDRSIVSWVKLMEFFPEQEDIFLGFLNQLTSVKKLILQKLPGAPDFKRPGFDD